jgi:hypothetical protein
MRQIPTQSASYTSQTAGMKLTRQTKIMRDWKIRNVFEILNKAVSEFYSFSEQLVEDEVIVLFKERVVSNSIFQKSTNVFP